ncbi:hypothetical protein CCR75_003603 [Bremia lactucae]|uniref:Guanylate-binding protein N-terminal domain-containing protein n=1 Tax=Bremia lactucae TaxID=4779 RepID=A0A976IBI6_BRELC|nr:hypothetical protein CCR75_003603 [Bremia lactucae]
MVDELLFSGQLIAVTMEETDDFRLQINNEAISFLQQLVEPILVVSFHGPKKSGKSALVHSLLQLEQESMTGGVWLYIKRANYPNAKYLAVLDRPGFGTEKQVDRLLYSILSGLSSVVVHHVNGQLTSDSVDHFSFLAGNAEGSDVPLAYDFPQSPRLLWVLQNVTTAKIKEKVQESGLSLQQIEQTYMCNALAALTDDSPSARAIKLFEAIYSNSRCFPVPPKETEAFKSRVEKLLRVLTDPIHNIYHKNMVFNGPLAGFVLVTMLSCRDNVFATFKGQIWDNLIDNCCLRVVEDAVKLYKLRMSQKLSSIVNISDPKESKQLLTANQDYQAAVQKCQKSIEVTIMNVPCESGVLYCKHSIAKREAKKNLRAIPVQSESRRTFFQKMFRNLVESEFATFQEKNECMSSELCHSLLATLHTKMTENVNAQSMVGPMDDENGYCVQSAEFKVECLT